MNTNKTYIAFDAVHGELHRNNLSIYNRLADWQRRFPTRYQFINTWDINFTSRHDSLVDSTLKTYLLKTMSKADNVLVVVSKHTDVDNPLLNWQISRCVNRFKLPVVIAYDDELMLNQQSVQDNWAILPQKIKKYIGRDSARMCHIPLTMDKIERALGSFSVKTNMYPWDSTTIF